MRSACARLWSRTEDSISGTLPQFKFHERDDQSRKVKINSEAFCWCFRKLRRDMKPICWFIILFRSRINKQSDSRTWRRNLCRRFGNRLTSFFTVLEQPPAAPSTGEFFLLFFRRLPGPQPCLSRVTALGRQQLRSRLKEGILSGDHRQLSEMTMLPSGK